MRTRHFVSLMLATSLLGACSSTLDKIENVGKPPPFTAVANPAETPGYKPLSWPMPENAPPQKQYANSLWQPGARAFYRDQRAGRVGDILRVNVKIKDKAEVDNETERKRDNSESLAAPAAFGMESILVGNFIPLKPNADPSNLLSVTGANNSKGTGNIKREEKIETQIAAMITQVLPNGNFVIDGSQEINVNFELRAISVKGVIRPQDIRSDNTIDYSQIAEARINYGGRGQLTDAQQQRWGSQVIDAVTPF